MNERHFLANVAGSATPWGLRVGGTERWLAHRAELAGTSKERRRGLLGRDHLDEGAALVIAPTQGIHTFGMRFPLDVVGVDRRGVVVSIKQGVPRRRVVLSLRAFAMVELEAGGCQACGLRVGERLDAVSQNASWGASGG